MQCANGACLVDLVRQSSAGTPASPSPSACVPYSHRATFVARCCSRTLKSCCCCSTGGTASRAAAAARETGTSAMPSSRLLRSSAPSLPDREAAPWEEDRKDDDALRRGGGGGGVRASGERVESKSGGGRSVRASILMLIKRVAPHQRGRRWRRPSAAAEHRRSLSAGSHWRERKAGLVVNKKMRG